MELPPFLHHHDVVRYVPFANHRPPPSPPNFSEDRNFYTHPHLRPPPPLPIAPPPPQSYRSLPPARPTPLPFKPHQSQFTFLNHRPIEDDHRRPHHLLDFPRRQSSPPRIFDRSLFDGNCPRLRIPELDNPFPDSRPDYWADRPRVQPENRVPLGFDREPHENHRPFNNQVPLSPYQTTENYKHDLEGSFRFRDDFINGFKPNDTEDPLRGRIDSHGCDHDNNYHHNRIRYASNSSGTSRSFVFNDSHAVSNPNALREFGSNLGNCESCHASVSDSRRFFNNIDETWRWGHVRRSSRELLDPPVETGNKEFGNVNGHGVQAVSSRRVPHIYDSGKFNYSGSREGKQEFLHSPRKKVQKKSALFRVQFGKHHNRNRNDEQHFPSARSDDSDHTSTFRSRGAPVYSNNRVKDNREGSPVDLDISFKSHALVAKAIVSSSSHEVESCRDLKSRNRKIRKRTIPESDLLNSPLTKLNEGPAESDMSAYALDYPTISYKDSKQSRDNIIDSGNEAVCGVGSLASSNSTIDSPVNTTLKEPVSDDGGNTVGSDGTSSLRIGKKKKVISPLSHLSRSQATKKNVEPVKVDRSINNPPAASTSQPDEADTYSKGETASDGLVSVHNVDLQPCPNEVTALLEHNKVDESTWAIVAEKDGTNIDSGGSYVPNTKRKKNSSTPLLDSSSPLKTKVDEGSVITGRSVNVDNISNSDKDPVELQNGSTFSEIVQVGEVRQQYCQNEPPVLLQNGLVKGSPEAKFSVGGNVNTELSCPGEIKIYEGPANLYSSFHDEHNALSSNNGLFRRQLKNTVPYIEAMDAGSEYNQATVSLESAAVEGSMRAIPPVGGNAIVGSSSAEETKIHESVLCANGSNLSAITASVSDNVLTNSESKIPVSEIGSSGDSSEESCPHGAIVLLENDPMEGPPKARMSGGVNVHGFGKGFTPKKRKDRDTQSGLSSPSTSGMPVNAVSIARPIDRTLSCPVKDLNFAEEEVVVSVAGNFNTGSQPCTDKDSIAHESSLTEGSFDNDLSVKGSCSVDQNRTSPTYIKKRKVLAPVSPSPIRSETQEGPVSAGTPTFRVELLSNTDGGLMQSEDIVAVSNVATVCSARVPPCSDGNHLFLTNLHDETVESVPDKLLNMCSPENLSIVTGLQLLNNKISPGQISNGKGCEDFREQDEKLVSEGLSSLDSLNTSLQDTTINNKSGRAVGNVHSINAKAGPQVARKTNQNMSFMSGGLNMRKNQLNSAVPKVFPAPSSFKKTGSSNHIRKPRTWHRTGNPPASSLPGKNSYPITVPPQWQSPRKIGKVQSASYIRKGNSLVRKPSLVAAAPNVSHALTSSVYQLNPMGIDEAKKRASVESRVHVNNPPNCVRIGLDATLERPKTPPLPCSTKLSDCTTISSRVCTFSPLADPPSNGFSETESDLSKLKENMDGPKPSEDAPNSSGTLENETAQIHNFESRSVQDDGNSVSIKTRKTVYVKRKSNQLVAASRSSEPSVQNVDKTKAPSSDGYYKRRKNQLIRKSSEIANKAAVPDDSINSEGKRVLQVIASSSSRRRYGKGLGKTYKPSKFSSVWTLRDAQTLKKENTLLCQVWPHLFPWKRATYWRSFMHNSVSISNNSSLSTISQILQLSRKRETIYTRSTRGFSLRISKILSVNGSSLKWSKSIDRNSKKANEEATLAVAAVEKKKREQHSAVTAGSRNRNYSSRERIFRIGSVRYKMDPTRQTLQRISDEELSGSTAFQSGKDFKKSPVPKRILIGNDEYVQTGNGNQLIRDPKKRTRILASEKVRWSLHTARLRSARKRKYCQFFTRFGKCNKDDGKCPYIHDPRKIAVCTKFLKGLCSDPNCKLTHKIIPERMQDCSYFLQGLCCNESCPYRHVNANPNASICERFLRGYCPNGDECRKKHSYVCPIFEATGICPQGSKCKLHHPKNRNKGKKTKPSGEQKNSQGRYFGSKHIVTSECRTAVSEMHSAKDDDDIFYQKGRFADYIHLDARDEGSGEITNPTTEQTTSCVDGEPAGIQLDVDELIKPIHIMKKKN